MRPFNRPPDLQVDDSRPTLTFPSSLFPGKVYWGSKRVLSPLLATVEVVERNNG